MMMTNSVVDTLLACLFQPPPPGYAPNAAQAAAMQGNSVVVTQKPSSVWSGTGDGGMTVW